MSERIFLTVNDCPEEMQFLEGLFLEFSTEEIQKAFSKTVMCSEYGVYKDVDISTIDAHKASEMVLALDLEDGGLDITNYHGRYTGDMKRFKTYAKKRVKNLMK